jgi:uncharacterized protein DUF3768
MTTDDTTKRIRELNDQFRRTLGGAGKRLVTAGVLALPFADQAVIIARVMNFDTFTPDNDPHGEHDFGASNTMPKGCFGRSIITTPLASTAPKTPPTRRKQRAF